MFHCHFAHPRAFWLLSHTCTYCGQTELRWLLSIEFDTTKLHIFQIRNLFHCVVESWWNMPFKGTRHGDGVVHGAVVMLLRLWKHAATLWHHAAWIRIVTSHNAWMGYEYSLPKQGRFISIIRTPSKQWGMCYNLPFHMLKKTCTNLCIPQLCFYIKYWRNYRSFKNMTNHPRLPVRGDSSAAWRTSHRWLFDETSPPMFFIQHSQAQMSRWEDPNEGFYN